MEQKKLTVIFPGIGYHRDKPLLYYAAKLAQSSGYEIVYIAYHDMPQKIRGNAEMMRNAAELAYRQTEEQLRTVDWPAYSDILLIGKSIGTIACARYAAGHDVSARQVWYTPLEATFSFPVQNDSCIAMIGDDDPWSDVEAVKKLAADKGIPLYSYPACNHSLETADIIKNIDILRDVISKTKQFIRL